MEIKMEKNGSALTLSLIGKLSIQEAKDLDKVVNDELADVTDLTFDLKDLTYVSSAGLRVLFTAQNIILNFSKKYYSSVMKTITTRV